VHEHVGGELVSNIDWRSAGAVTPVKNQGGCASCWAFAAVGSLEGAWQVASGKLTSMSEQQLVDCSTANDGCDGGVLEYVFAYLQETVDVATETSYPYQGVQGTCRTTGYTPAVPQGGVTGYRSAGTTAADLKSALQLGPVSVAIEADQMSFGAYRSGILNSASCGTRPDHGVTLVGYDSSEDYFIVKNSWGARWGNKGFAYLSAQNNTCGILNDAWYPIVSSAVQV